MTVTETDLRERFPTTFPATFPSSVLTRSIAAAELRVDQVFLGSLADEAITYLAAHLATVDRLAQSAGGGVSSASAGGVSVSFAQGTDLFKGTSAGFYGEYLRILQLVSAGVSISGWVG